MRFELSDTFPRQTVKKNALDYQDTFFFWNNNIDYKQKMPKMKMPVKTNKLLEATYFTILNTEVINIGRINVRNNV